MRDGREFLHDASWDDLRHFAAFVHGKSLSAAAARLSVDHATVARRIAALEAALGLRLVDRRARTPVLTAAGERIAALVLQVEDAAFGVARAARGLSSARGGPGGADGPAGDVSISAPPTLARALIAPRLPVLRGRYPALRIHVIAERRVASLARREADVAVRLMRPREAGLVGRKLGSFQFALYGARPYITGRRPGAYELIGFDEEGALLAAQRWLAKVAGKRPIVLRTNDLEVQLAAARAGLGVAALPDFLAALHPELVRVTTRVRPVTREVWLVVHEDLRAAPAVRAVIDFLVEACRDLARTPSASR